MRPWSAAVMSAERAQPCPSWTPVHARVSPGLPNLQLFARPSVDRAALTQCVHHFSRTRQELRRRHRQWWDRDHHRAGSRHRAVGRALHRERRLVLAQHDYQVRLHPSAAAHLVFPGLNGPSCHSLQRKRRRAHLARPAQHRRWRRRAQHPRAAQPPLRLQHYPLQLRPDQCVSFSLCPLFRIVGRIHPSQRR